ncbi:Integrase, catalytic core protein [Phytophthora megakarya]|uniref:Integrase, catalytic core protein n=1 Tax=Phytophthora megakarya TaxID=4795 RepID=A0A225WTR6_9STRA|nr:Integrase, catalytic core protein [Phytophthora megakarya]
MKIVGNRWLFRAKYKSTGEIERFKARLMIKGFMKIYDIQYLEVYSPVVRQDTLGVSLTLAAIWDYEAHQMDVTTAFLNGEIDTELSMEQSEGYIQEGKEDWVFLLFKSIYGLKQAPHTALRDRKKKEEEKELLTAKSKAVEEKWTSVNSGHFAFV